MRDNSPKSWSAKHAVNVSTVPVFGAVEPQPQPVRIKHGSLPAKASPFAARSGCLWTLVFPDTPACSPLDRRQLSQGDYCRVYQLTCEDGVPSKKGPRMGVDF